MDVPHDSDTYHPEAYALSRSSALRQILGHVSPPKQWRVTNETFSFEISLRTRWIRRLRTPESGHPARRTRPARTPPRPSPRNLARPPLPGRPPKPPAPRQEARAPSVTERTRGVTWITFVISGGLEPHRTAHTVHSTGVRFVRLAPGRSACRIARLGAFNPTGPSGTRDHECVGIAVEVSVVSELHGNSSEMARVWISCTERWRIRQSQGPADAPRSWGCNCDWGVHGACRNTRI